MLKIINTQKRARDNFLIIWSDKSNQSGHEPSLIQKVANSPPHPAKYGFVLHDGQLHTHTHTSVLRQSASCHNDENTLGDVSLSTPGKAHQWTLPNTPCTLPSNTSHLTLPVNSLRKHF